VFGPKIFAIPSLYPHGLSLRGALAGWLPAVEKKICGCTIGETNFAPAVHPVVGWARIGHEMALVMASKANLLDSKPIEQLTLNQWVPGSSPGGRTNKNPVSPL